MNIFLFTVGRSNFPKSEYFIRTKKFGLNLLQKIFISKFQLFFVVRIRNAAFEECATEWKISFYLFCAAANFFSHFFFVGGAKNWARTIAIADLIFGCNFSLKYHSAKWSQKSQSANAINNMIWRNEWSWDPIINQFGWIKIIK